MEVRSNENDGARWKRFAVVGDGKIAFRGCPGSPIFPARPKHGASPLLSRRAVPSEWLGRTITERRGVS